MKYEPLFWFRVTVGGRRWNVYLSAASLTRDLAEGAPTGDRCAGLADAKLHTIWIDAGQTPTSIDTTALHELLHVCLAASYVWPAERIVTALEVPLWRLISGLGFRWPDKPAGWRALHRYAKRCDPSDLDRGT